MKGQQYLTFPPEVNAFLTGNYRETEEVTVPLFRELSPEEEAYFRQHARETYLPGNDIPEVYHPIWKDEAEKMNAEIANAQ